MRGSFVGAALITLALAACGSGEPECRELFGAPTANTGLGADQCGASCSCPDSFSPPDYSAEVINEFRSRTLLDAPTLLSTNPYDSPSDFPEDPDAFCGVIDSGSGEYRLQSFQSLPALESAGARLTHRGACGLCSSLQDLAVYMENGDLAGPVRQCGLDGLNQEFEETVSCIEAIGFSAACAQIWAYNTLNTRDECLLVCLEALNASYHTGDGALNPCIECDEEKSGPVFKAVAGRTRRNSGLPSALCRPCGSVARVIHDY